MATLIKQELTPAWNGTRLINLNERTEALLREVEQVAGLQSAFVCDSRGAILGAWVTGKDDPNVFDRVGVCLAESFAALNANEFHEIELRFANRILYTRNLGNAFVAVLIALDTNLALLRITLNVAVVPFESDTILQNNLKAVVSSDGQSLQDDDSEARRYSWAKFP